MTTGAPVVPSTPKTSGLAITSLILGIVGPCSLGLLSIVGLILGIMAAKKIKASGGTIGGRGLAVAGIIVSILTLIIGLAIAAAIAAGTFYGLTGAKDIAGQVMCENNLRQLCAATINYCTDQKGKLPPADISERCSWNRRMSSAVAVSGDRFRNAANFLQLRMWPLCVPAQSLRAFISSIMRRRSGLMVSVLMGNSCLG